MISVRKMREKNGSTSKSWKNPQYHGVDERHHAWTRKHGLENLAIIQSTDGDVKPALPSFKLLYPIKICFCTKKWLLSTA
jgi:hypothetical protein